MRKNIRILLLDVETKPELVYTFGLFNQNIGINQIKETGGVICWAAKWLGEKKVHFAAEWDDNDFMGKMWDLLDEADAVVHYNGNSFDMPKINWEFAKYDGTPPSPYVNIDLLQTVRQNFKPTSRKLDFIASELGIGSKISNAGMPLWIGCMEGDKKCQREMKAYNRQDTVLLEELYHRLLPWMKSHPNQQLFGASANSCPKCGEESLINYGFTYTKSAKYQRYKCTGCGGYGKYPKPIERATLK